MSRAAKDALKEVLGHYLDQFGCIYNYCAKIYFLPTYGHPTGMMEEHKDKIVDPKWDTLLTSNHTLINDLINFGEKDHLTTENDVKDYMLLAVRFWQAKEKYFELMDPILDESAHTDPNNQ